MEFEILTMDGNFIRIKNVVGVCTPNKDNPYVFRFTTKKEQLYFPSKNVKYCKQMFEARE